MFISKAVRVTSYIFLFFVVLFITMAILFNCYFDKKIIKAAKEQFSHSTNNEYALSIDDIKINLFDQSITIHNIEITPLKKINNLKSHYVFKAKALSFINFSIISYLKKQTLLVDKVEFEESEISVFLGSEKTSKYKPLPPESDFLKQSAFSKKLNSISIAHIHIINSKINIYKYGAYSQPFFTSNDNNISIKNFGLNLRAVKKTELFLMEKTELAINNFYYNLEDGLYTLYGKRLYASFNDSILSIDTLKLMPNFNKKEFAKKAKYQTSRTEIFTSKVNFNKIDYNLLFKEKKLTIHKVELIDYAIDVFRDNTFPLEQVVRPSLQSMVKNIPFFVSLDTIEMKNGALNFEAITPGSALTGKMSISNMNITIAGIQNDTTTYKDNQSIKAIVRGRVLKQGHFIETCIFPLKSTEEFFYCTGIMTAMPMASFNPIIESTKHLSIKSGQLDFVSFSFKADKNSSNGVMKFAYHDLKVELLNEHDSKNGIKQKLKTLLMNKFIVEPCNPEKNSVVRISKIYTEHNPYRYFVNYSMQSLLSGIEPAIVGEHTAKWLKKKQK